MEEIGINNISVMLVPADSPEYGTFSLHITQKEFIYPYRGNNHTYEIQVSPL